MKHSGYSQNLDDPQVVFEKKIDLEIKNPHIIRLKNEPVHISLKKLKDKYPGFNEKFYRVKHKPDRLEPLEIFSQIIDIPGRTGSGKELVFQIDLEPGEKQTVEIQYNTSGEDMPDYPVRVKSYPKWYKDGSNIAWENELTAYRWYTGIVDCFGKSFPHLCLESLRSDSYHHERLWGQDYYMVGKSAGLGGIGIFEGDSLTRCYGAGDVPYIYSHEAFGNGSVCAGAIVSVEDKKSGEILTESSISAYHGRLENRVKTVAIDFGKGKISAPGMTKFKTENVDFNEHEGFLSAWGRPVEEYGIIGTALVWDPKDFSGAGESEDTRFIKLSPGEDGCISYFSIGVWFRGSSEQPSVMDSFKNYVSDLSVIKKAEPEIII